MKTTAHRMMTIVLALAIFGTTVWAADGQRGPGRRRGPQVQSRQGFEGRPQQGPMGRRGFGQRGGRGRGAMARPGAGNPLAGLRHLIMGLDLTDEQMEEIKTVFEEEKEAIREAHKAVQEAQKALHDTIIEDGTEEAIRNAAQDLAAEITDEALLMAQVRNAVMDTLTDEQKTKLETLKEEARIRQERMREQMRKRFEERRQRFDGPNAEVEIEEDEPEEEPVF